MVFYGEGGRIIASWPKSFCRHSVGILPAFCRHSAPQVLGSYVARVAGWWCFVRPVQLALEVF